MTAAQLNGLFQPFMQADSSVTRTYGGTGLGLAISRRLARALGGDILVTSAHGAGSTFTLSIDPGPLNGVNFIENARLEDFLRPKDNGRPTSPSNIDQQDALRGMRILLAEDGPDNQRLIAFILRKSGANVTVVENGEQAVKAVDEASSDGTPFDAILMDMQMPVMDGYNATRRLRELNHNEYIVALTAHAMASDRDKCLATGCNEYASKPIDRSALIQLLKRSASHAK
jgi:CheY-like chemotaxis protein